LKNSEKEDAMAGRIQITAGSIVMAGELKDTPTARAIRDALPIRAVARTWGDEIYFPIPVDESLDETAREVVERGDIGYWPTGMSRGAEIRPASAVNVVGKVLGDPGDFKVVRDGDAVELDIEEQ
jgi:hypothetical protein